MSTAWLKIWPDCRRRWTRKRLQTETAAELDALLPAILYRPFKGEF